MRKAMLVLLPVILVVASASAYCVDLANYGFHVTRTEKQNNQHIYTLRSQSGFAFTVAATAPLTKGNAEVLQHVVQTLSGWKLLHIARARVVFKGARADILVVPSSFVYKGVNLADYMPSGMQFYYDRYLEYDFRMLKDNLFLRMKGEVFDEKQFAERLYSAVENPVLYLRTHNPEYLLRRLDELQQQVQKLETAFAQQTKALTQAEKGLTKKVDHLVGEANRYSSRQDKLRAKQAAINDKQQALSLDVERQLGDLKRQNAHLVERLDGVRYSLLVLNNRGFFGRIYPVDRSTVQRIVNMKRADPSLSRAQARRKLRAEGVSVSKKVVSLVFDVYFNDFK